LQCLELMGKRLVRFSLHGVPTATRQLLKNVNSETNFWYMRNKKKEQRQKIIRIITDFSVKSELF
jgi:hypothetical protein